MACICGHLDPKDRFGGRIDFLSQMAGYNGWTLMVCLGDRKTSRETMLFQVPSELSVAVLDSLGTL
jgi:hypothetical protein